MKRKQLYIILTVLILAGLITISLFIRLTPAAHLDAYGAYDPDYLTVSGVLHNDSYTLYPFANKSLKIGFSKYGEMIDYDTKIGLEYNSATDPWAPNTDYVDEYEWVEGWVINITYWHEDTFYNRWAFALYSDYSGTGGIGGDWNEDVRNGALNASVTGGRKTNGGAVTDNIKVLYNGPRRYVGLMKTTLYESSSHTNPLVSITFTIVFNKVKKQAVWFKDIKRIESPKRWGNLQVEFGERGQWDLESNSGETSGNAPKSYAYIFENQTTVYDYHYHGWYNNSLSGFSGTYDVAQIIDDQLDYVAYAAYWPKPLKSWVNDIAELSNADIYTTSSTVEQNWTGTGSVKNFTLSQTPVAYPHDQTTGNWDETPMVFVDNNHQVNASDYVYYSTTNTINFTTAPSNGANIKAYYKIDDCTNDVPGSGIEPCSPFTNAEWCFEMDATNDMFRCCSVFGVTDWNNATDADHASYSYNTLDCEIQYLLNETFNPYDLYDAVHKQEYRWLEKETLTSALTAGTNYTLTSGLTDRLFYQDLDNSASEKVKTRGWATEYGLRAASDSTYGWRNEYEDSIDAHSKNYAAYLNATTSGDYAMIKCTPVDYGVVAGAQTFSSIVDVSFYYYLVAAAEIAPHLQIKLYNDTSFTGWINLGAKPNWNTSSGWVHYNLNNIEDFLRPAHGDTADDAWYIRGCTTGIVDCEGNTVTADPAAASGHSWEYWTHRLGCFYVAYIGVCAQYQTGDKNCSCYIDDINVAYLNRTSGIRYRRVFNMEEDKVIPCDWTDYCKFAEKVLINDTLAYPYRANSSSAGIQRAYYNYTMYFESGNITFSHALGVGTRLKILYSTIEENEKGRYEWIVVGKDAATIDSIGAAYITQAFDSRKDIEVLLAGLDINDTTYGVHAPFVMAGSVTGTKSSYRDSLGRCHLRDDWCNTTAISSSNMIFAGGPCANLGSEYFNEFTMAFYARSAYVTNNSLSQSNNILAVSCWGKNVTGSGYAVVSVYKDLNGTIGFLIWGYDGSDTYYASKWFWDYAATQYSITYDSGGIEYLQSENRGVTDIMLKISYTTHTPTVTIVERLGAVSEKDYHDP